MKITIKIIAVNVVYEGTSRTSGLPCQSLEVIGEKSGMRTQRVVFKVFDNAARLTKNTRFHLRPGAINTISYPFGAHEYEGKW